MRAIVWPFDRDCSIRITFSSCLTLTRPVGWLESIWNEQTATRVAHYTLIPSISYRYEKVASYLITQSHNRHGWEERKERTGEISALLIINEPIMTIFLLLLFFISVRFVSSYIPTSPAAMMPIRKSSRLFRSSSFEWIFSF